MSIVFPSDPMDRYNTDTYKVIMKGLQRTGDDLILTLQVLSEMLIFGQSSLNSSFPSTEISTKLMTISLSTLSNQIFGICIQCVASMLELDAYANSQLCQFRFLNSLYEKLTSADDKNVMDGIIHVFSVIVKIEPAILASNFSMRPFLLRFNDLSLLAQREAIHSVNKLIKSCFSDHFCNDIVQIFALLDVEDLIIRKNVLSAITKITNSISKYSVPRSLVTALQETIEKTTDNEILTVLYSLYYRTSKDRSIAHTLIRAPPDFETLLFNSPCTTNPAAATSILSIIQVIIPPPDLPRCLWSAKNKKYSSSEALEQALIPIMCRYVIECNNHEILPISLLAAVTSHHTFEPSRRLLSALLPATRSSTLAPFVLAICLRFKDMKVLSRSGILKCLQATSVTRECKNWYKEKLGTIKVPATVSTAQLPASIEFTQSLAHIVNYVVAEQVMSYEFANTKLIDKATAIIRGGGPGGVDIDPLIQLAYDALSFPTVRIKDPFKIATPVQLANTSVKLIIKHQSEASFTYSAKLVDTFMTIEGAYNILRNPASVTALNKEIRTNSSLASKIDLPHDVTHDPLLYAVLSRGFNVPGYQRCSFRIGSVICSAYDTVISLFSRAFPRSDRVPTTVEATILPLEACREDLILQHNFGDVQKVIDFLNVVNSIAPDKIKPNQLFVQQVVSTFSNIFATLSMYSPAPRIVFLYPFLFPFSDREFLFRALVADPVGEMAHRYRPNEKGPLPINLHIVVNRDRLFDDGCEVLSKIACSPIHTQFVFAGEIGFGDGPCQEFFTEMSHCFSETKRRIWRDDGHDVYAWSEKGLFPMPNADPNCFYPLGILCAKAITMKKLIDIPFNPAFFKLIMGREVALEEVDPYLARSLGFVEGLYGLPFVYPGTELELEPHGADKLVDSNNVVQYARLIKEFSCGRYLYDKVRMFLNGFEKVIPKSALMIFAPEEIVRILCGDEISLTQSALRESIEFEHGYTRDSPQAEMFFKVIETMSTPEKKLFVKFLTGSSRLPIGGLAALKPHLTIAKRVCEGDSDKYLPSVMTCTNYFKLPPYTSFDIMQSKVLQAINEGSQSFDLS